jgi:threonine dehydrogenase-like Zn-dependent dehydrogenase
MSDPNDQTMMRALVLRDFGDLAVEDRPVAPLALGEVRVRPLAVGICASDVHGYLGHSARRWPGMVMGHEAAGVIIETAPDVEDIAVGTRVAVNPVVGCGSCRQCLAGHENTCERRRLYGCVADLPGAFAGSFAVRAANVAPAEPDTPPEWLALCEPLAVGAHAARLAGAKPGCRIAVVGGGMIGVAAAYAAWRFGADEVVIYELDADRRETAARLGLDARQVPGEGESPGSFDAAIEAVGFAPTLALAVAATPERGEIIMVGLATPTVEIPAIPLVMGERVLRGSAVYTQGEFREVVADVVSGTTDLTPLIGEHFDLDGLPRAFAELAAGTRRDLRTLFVP